MKEDVAQMARKILLDNGAPSFLDSLAYAEGNPLILLGRHLYYTFQH